MESTVCPRNSRSSHTLEKAKSGPRQYIALSARLHAGGSTEPSFAITARIPHTEAELLPHPLTVSQGRREGRIGRGLLGLVFALEGCVATLGLRQLVLGPAQVELAGLRRRRRQLVAHEVKLREDHHPRGRREIIVRRAV